jgi:cell surface protein SprA
MNKSRIPQNWLFYRKSSNKKPQSVLSAYTYDPFTDRYIYTNSVDGFSINYPIILTPKQYESLVLKESMRLFQEKTDAIDGKKEGSEAAKKDLLQNIT